MPYLIEGVLISDDEHRALSFPDPESQPVEVEAEEIVTDEDLGVSEDAESAVEPVESEPSVEPEPVSE